MNEVDCIQAVTREQVGKALQEKARRWMDEIFSDCSMLIALNLPKHGYVPTPPPDGEVGK